MNAQLKVYDAMVGERSLTLSGGRGGGPVGMAAGAASVFTLPEATIPIVGSDQRFPGWWR